MLGLDSLRNKTRLLSIGKREEHEEQGKHNERGGFGDESELIRNWTARSLLWWDWSRPDRIRPLRSVLERSAVFRANKKHRWNVAVLNGINSIWQALSILP